MCVCVWGGGGGGGGGEVLVCEVMGLFSMVRHTYGCTAFLFTQDSQHGVGIFTELLDDK